MLRRLVTIVQIGGRGEDDRGFGRRECDRLPQCVRRRIDSHARPGLSAIGRAPEPGASSDLHARPQCRRVDGVDLDPSDVPADHSVAGQDPRLAAVVASPDAAPRGRDVNRLGPAGVHGDVRYDGHEGALAPPRRGSEGGEGQERGDEKTAEAWGSLHQVLHVFPGASAAILPLFEPRVGAWRLLGQPLAS